MLYIGLYWGTIENRILSETTRPIALIFGMLQNQVCSNYDPMANNGTILGVACVAKAYTRIRKIKKKDILVSNH